LASLCRGGVVIPTPNPQRVRPEYPVLSGTSPLTRLAWVALAGSTIPSTSLRIISPRKPHNYVKGGYLRGGGNDLFTLINHTTRAFYVYVYLGMYMVLCGPGSSVGIATELRTGRSGIESRWGRDFPSVQTGPGAHPASCKMGTDSFPRVKCGQGVLLTTHTLLVPRSWNSRAIPLPTLWATPGL